MASDEFKKQKQQEQIDAGKNNLVKLDGTLIKADGSTYKSNFFKCLKTDLSDYSHITYTQEEAQRIQAHMFHLSTGSAAATPMICAGFKCSMAAICPLAIETKKRQKADPNAKSLLPYGLICPIEKNLITEWTKLYIQEYEVGEGAFTEIQMCRELAEIEIYLWRINHQLSKQENSVLIQEDVVGNNEQGEVFTKKSPSALFEVKQNLSNRKSKLIKLMVGDRQEKYKKEAALKVKSIEDPSSQTAQLKTRLMSLIEEAKKVDLQLKEASGDIIDAEAEDKSTSISPQDLIDGVIDQQE